MIVGVMNLSHWNRSPKFNMLCPYCAANLKRPNNKSSPEIAGADNAVPAFPARPDRIGTVGRDDTVPLAQVLKIEHRPSFPPANQAQSVAQIRPATQAPGAGYRSGPAGGTNHAGERVEIAAKCGHNLSSPRHFPTHDAHV